MTGVIGQRQPKASLLIASVVFFPKMTARGGSAPTKRAMVSCASSQASVLTRDL